MKLKYFLALSACVLLSFLIYSPAIKAPFLFDDEINIVSNPDIRKLENLKSRLVFRMEKIVPNTNIPTRAFTFLTFTLDYALWGRSPAGFRIVNIFLHGLTSFAVFLLLLGILSRGTGEGAWFGAALGGAMLFSAHPLHGDVVVYISNRSDGLATLFSLVSLLLFSGYGPKFRFRFVLSIIAFAVALLSKEIAIVLPLILILFDYFIASEMKLAEVFRNWKRHAPYWTVLGLYLVYRRAVLGDLMYQWTLREESWTLWEYLSMQVVVIPQYLKLLIVPIGQCVDHLVLPPASFFEPRVLISLTAWFSIAAACIILIRAASRQSGARGMKSSPDSSILFRTTSFSALWFFVALLPTSSVFPIFDAMVERRVYWPSIGWALCVTAFYVWLFDAERTPANRLKMTALLALHVVILSLGTFNRSAMYRHPEKLWVEAIARYPENPRAYINFGSYIEGSDPVKAAELCRKAISLNPNYSVAHNNLGNALYKMNDAESAAAEYQNAINLKPDWAQPYINLAGMRYQAHQLAEAEVLYQKALSLDGGYAIAFNNLGSIYFERGKAELAADFYQKAIDVDSSYGLAYYNLALVLIAQKRYEPALQSLMAAQKLMPGNPAVENNLQAIRSALR